MRLSLSVFWAIVLLLLLAGCGGGSNGVSPSNATGRATFTITWPKQTRLIPNASNSIVVQILNGNTPLKSQTLARPSSGGTASATFPLLPMGTLTARATAYPQSNGSGVAQAQATVPLTIQANQNTSFTLTMASTIDHLELSPSPASVQVGQSLDLTAVAKDGSGQIVLLSAGKLSWGSQTSMVASVDATGRVNGVSAGTTNITVTDQESGKFASVLVTVSNTNISSPIDVTGFNRDVIFEASSTTTAVTFDDTSTVWIEDGLNGYAGLPAGVFTSRLPNPVTGGSTNYQLQPFTGNNVLTLAGASPQGTLTLVQAKRYRTLSIAAASSNARFVPGIGTLTLNFEDGSTSSAVNYNARDWWGEGTNDDPNRILATSTYRATNAGSNVSLANVQIDTLFVHYNLYETTLDLSNVGGVDYTQKRLKSVTFNQANGALLTGIFALSGVVLGP